MQKEINDNFIQNQLPICLIDYNKSTGFSVTKQGEEFLSSLDLNNELAIISIIGKIKSGKSYFLNKTLLKNRNQGFKVTPTINPCTKVKIKKNF